MDFVDYILLHNVYPINVAQWCLLNQEVSILKWAQVNTCGGQCLYIWRDQSSKQVNVAACQDQQYNDDGDHLFSLQLSGIRSDRVGIICLRRP